MVKSDKSLIVLDSRFGLNSVRGMGEGTFVWVLFKFHLCGEKSKELVRPPKLGGNEKMGVFATRSPFRPNNIGMSLVKVLKVSFRDGRVEIRVAGADMVDGTPVLDLKPYHGIADAPWEEYQKPWFETSAVRKKKVVFAPKAVVEKEFKEFVEETLALDPRPGYHRDERRVYVSELNKKNVFWRASDGASIEVIKVEET